MRVKKQWDNVILGYKSINEELKARARKKPVLFAQLISTNKFKICNKNIKRARNE